MREIKFRAWGKDVSSIKMFYDIDLYSYDSEYHSFNASNGSVDASAKPLTFMQYTGLKDKNGKEIYEGDIIEFADKWEWYRSSYAIEMHFADSEGLKGLKEQYDAEPMHRFEVRFSPYNGYNLSESDLKNNYYEVIGNIYENPELLESEEE